MRFWTKFFVLVLTAVLTLGIFSVPAMADVTRVRDTGDGSVEVKWDDDDPDGLCLVPKMSDNFDSDVEKYGYINIEPTNYGTMTVYYFAPGQNYWVVMADSNGNFSSPYAYKPGRVSKFSEFRTQPSISNWQLKEKTFSNKPVNLASLIAKELENPSDNVSFGVAFQYHYPQLKAERRYFGQIVITDPEDIKYVDYAFEEVLPAGRTYAYVDFYTLDEYFNFLTDTRGYVPVGVYTFALYWDGLLVCSVTFRVR